MPTTQTRVSGADQLKVGAKGQSRLSAADRDDLVFHRLAHHFEHTGVEFSELIEKENATVCQRDSTRMLNIPAADQPSVADV